MHRISSTLRLTFAPLVKKALPAVVNVESVVRARTTRQFRSSRTPECSAGHSARAGGLLRTVRLWTGHRKSSSLAAVSAPGVIVTRDGYILTNNHVVEGATEVKVSTNDRREFQAKVVGTDPRSDVAVIKIQASNLPVLPISDSGKVQVGDVALAIGDPFGIGQTVTMGIISATGRADFTRQLRRLHSDRRGNQSRQLGRRADQYQR